MYCCIMEYCDLFCLFLFVYLSDIFKHFQQESSGKPIEKNEVENSYEYQ